MSQINTFDSNKVYYDATHLKDFGYWHCETLAPRADRRSYSTGCSHRQGVCLRRI